MLKHIGKSGLLITGVLLMAVGAGLFAWYNTIVLDSAEIRRLEAGGASTSGIGELLALLASPVLALAGAGLVYFAWYRSRTKSLSPGEGSRDFADRALRRH